MVIYTDIDETIYHSLNKPSYTTSIPIKNWGVKYYDPKFGKSNYDLFINDKNLNTID